MIRNEPSWELQGITSGAIYSYEYMNAVFCLFM